MNPRSNIIICIISFLSGSLVCYLLIQFSFLEIDTKVNVTETILSVGTAVIGLYIASSLQKSHNRNQKLAEYLQIKHDKIWDIFSNFSGQIKAQNHIQLVDIVKAFKNIQQNISSQKKIFSAFELDSDHLNKIESALDILENILVSHSHIENNILFYQSIQSQLDQGLNDVEHAFAVTLKAINRIN